MTDIRRASVLIAAGTVASRATGLIRTIVLVSAVGATTSAGNAFAIANQLPNNIYAVISTGLLSAVVVPQIVKAATHDDGGRAFISRLFTLAAVVLLGATLIAMIAAPWLIALYTPGFSPEQRGLATAFAYWCLPQVFFYGLYALVGEALNARKLYGPYTWTPIINNVVSIVGFAVFMLLIGGASSATQWTPGMIALLGGTATLGIVAQAVLLLLFWRRAGVHVRPDFRWKGVGLGQIGKMAGWTFFMVIAGQIAGLIQTRVVSAVPQGEAGVMVAANAWLLFMLPYSIIVISIGTPYFTQLSEHAVAGRLTEVRADIDRSIRVLALFTAGALAALLAASVPASRIFTDSPSEAVGAAAVLVCYLVGLAPLAVLFVVQRTFYALGDTRTPFLFTALQCVLVVLTACGGSLLVSAGALEVSRLAATVALGQSLSSLIQVVVATTLLRRRLGGLHLASWSKALTKFAAAAAVASSAGWLTFEGLGGVNGWTTSSKPLGIVGMAVIGVVTLAFYCGVLVLLRAPELRDTVSRRGAR